MDGGQQEIRWDTVLPRTGGGMTLDEARDAVRAGMRKGIVCPCCERRAKMYAEAFRWNAACALQAMVREWNRAGRPRPFPWHHLPSLLATVPLKPPNEDKKRAALCNGTAASAEKWGLMEERVGDIAEGSPHKGEWRLTMKGVLFVLGRITIPMHACTYDGRLLGFEGPQISFREASENRFDYDEALTKEVGDAIPTPF